MPLSNGSRLGPYEILAPLGAGGMGEVWRARDSKLGREVAIKVLPESVAGDAERLARFAREAKVLASLNHPGIAAIYGLEDSGGAPALVMELVEGPTLEDRIAQGPIPIDEALPIAREIAEGLEYAHERGIVHRDLKPANIKLTEEGKIKILDFGLAKALDPAGGVSSPDVTHSPTITAAAATQAGVILGTAAYMSPEQARGKPADKRADIWAFGCVLWEMLTGQRLFHGETVSDTLAAVLTREPRWEELLAGTPASVRELLRRCLAKDPRRRLQAIGDGRIALEDAGSGAAPAAERRGTWPRFTAIALTAGGLVATFVIGWLAARGRTTTPSRPNAPAAFTQLTDFPGVEREPSLSPDGQTVVYVSAASGNDDIYLLRIGGHNPIDLTPDSPARDRSPAFSPDGSRIAFRSEREGGGIFVMGATGESARRLTDFGFNPSWSPDAREIVVATSSFEDPFSRGSNSELFAVDLVTGKRRLVCSGDAVQPAWSPHGQRIAYWGVPESGQRDLWTISADGSEAKRGGVALTNDAALDWSPVWSASGREVYFLSDRGGTMNVWRIPIDERSGRPLGDAGAVTVPAVWVGGFSLSKDERRLVFAVLERKSTIEEVAFDPAKGSPAGSPRAILRGSRVVSWLDWSPDGRRLVFGTLGSRENLYSIASDGSAYRQLTDDGYRNRGPRWASDGRSIAYMSNRGGRFAVWSIDSDGGNLRPLFGVGGLPVWSPDGRRFAVSSANFGAFIAEPGTSAVAPIPIPSVGDKLLFLPSAWAPDGRSIVGVVARMTMAPGEIYSYSLDRPAYLDLKIAGSNPVWLPNGRLLLFSLDGAILVLDTEKGVVRELLSRGSVSNDVWQKFALSRDGRKLAFVRPYEDGDLWMLSLSAAEAPKRVIGPGEDRTAPGVT